MFDNPITVQTGTDAGRFQSQLIAAGLPVAYVNVSGTQADVFTTTALTQAQLTTLATIAAQQGPRVVRSLYSIAASIFALGTSQKANIVTALFTGSVGTGSQLWQQDTGPNAASMAAVYAALMNSSGVVAFNQAQQLVLAAMYVQDHTSWLVNPAFDPSVNVDGTAPAS